jgi:hypothetical protein
MHHRRVNEWCEVQLRYHDKYCQRSSGSDIVGIVRSAWLYSSENNCGKEVIHAVVSVVDQCVPRQKDMERSWVMPYFAGTISSTQYPNQVRCSPHGRKIEQVSSNVNSRHHQRKIDPDS